MGYLGRSRPRDSLRRPPSRWGHECHRPGRGRNPCRLGGRRRARSRTRWSGRGRSPRCRGDERRRCCWCARRCGCGGSRRRRGDSRWLAGRRWAADDQWKAERPKEQQQAREDWTQSTGTAPSGSGAAASDSTAWRGDRGERGDHSWIEHNRLEDNTAAGHRKRLFALPCAGPAAQAFARRRAAQRGRMLLTVGAAGLSHHLGR